MTKDKDVAAHALVGLVLKNKWEVLEKITPKLGSTGGFFGVNYKVSDGNNEAFLKALNFNAFFQLFRGKSVVEIISEQTKAFQFEKELLERCKERKLSKVSMILDSGEEYVDGFTIPNVPYLIFEMANGDIRSHMNFSKNIEIAWKLKSLHDVAVGLRQLHGVKIGHQDLKPSNVLLFEDGVISKIGDLGRSLCSDIKAPHADENDFPGDFNYAPPEFLYGYVEPEWEKRIKATDFYLLGSLITFYFSGTIMTSLIGKNLDSQFMWNKWTGSFSDVRSYLVGAFHTSLKEFQNSIDNDVLANELTNIVEILCYPYPENRGHKNMNYQFDLQRIISKFDLLSKKIEYKII